MSVTSNVTKQATKYTEQQSSSCETPGCGEPAKLQCPTCIKLNIRGSFFCSQDCFKGNWDLHKALHKLAKNHTCTTSEAHSLMASTEKDNWPVPPSSKFNTTTTAGGVYWNKLRTVWQYDLPLPLPEPVPHPSHHDKVVDKLPCSQVMVKEYSTEESTSSSELAAQRQRHRGSSTEAAAVQDQQVQQVQQVQDQQV